MNFSIDIRSLFMVIHFFFLLCFLEFFVKLLLFSCTEDGQSNSFTKISASYFSSLAESFPCFSSRFYYRYTSWVAAASSPGPSTARGRLLNIDSHCLLCSIAVFSKIFNS